MTEKYEDLKEKAIKADAEQQEEGKGESPSSDVYSNVKERDPETGVEVPTEEAVEEAREWSEENKK